MELTYFGASAAAFVSAYLVRKEPEWTVLGVGLGIFFFGRALAEG